MADLFDETQDTTSPVDDLFNDTQSITDSSDDSDFIPGVQRGVQNLQAMTYGAGALAGSGLKKLGAETVGQKLQDVGMEGYRRNIEEAKQYEKKHSFKDIYTGEAGVGGAIDWAQGTLGELVPSMVEAAIGAGIGSAVAPGAGTAVGALAGRTLLKKGIEKTVQQAMKKGLGDVTEAQLRKEVTKQAMKKLGGKVGIAGAVMPMESGGMYAELLEDKGIDAPETALMFGALATAMEFFGGNSKLVDTFVDALSNGAGGLVKKSAKEILTNIPQEALQEGGQELMGILNTVANTDEKLLTAENLEVIIESMAAGAIGGGAGAVMQTAMNQGQPETPDIPPSIDRSEAGKLFNADEKFTSSSGITDKYPGQAQDEQAQAEANRVNQEKLEDLYGDKTKKEVKDAYNQYDPNVPISERDLRRAAGSEEYDLTDNAIEDAKIALAILDQRFDQNEQAVVENYWGGVKAELKLRQEEMTPGTEAFLRKKFFETKLAEIEGNVKQDIGSPAEKKDTLSLAEQNKRQAWFREVAEDLGDYPTEQSQAVAPEGTDAVKFGSEAGLQSEQPDKTITNEFGDVVDATGTQVIDSTDTAIENAEAYVHDEEARKYNLDRNRQGHRDSFPGVTTDPDGNPTLPTDAPIKNVIGEVEYSVYNPESPLNIQRDTDVINTNGKPYKVLNPLMKKLDSLPNPENYEIIETKDGFVGRLVPGSDSSFTNEQQEESTPQFQVEEPQVRYDGESGGLHYHTILDGPAKGATFASMTNEPDDVAQRMEITIEKFKAEDSTQFQTSEEVAEFRKANNLPEIKMRADGSHPTQVGSKQQSDGSWKGTAATYLKVWNLMVDRIKSGRILDYGASKNVGAQTLEGTKQIDSFEPNPEAGFIPTYNDTSNIPSNSYDGIFNNAVLNVIPDDIRDAVVKELGRILAPKGKAYINVRGKDVFDAKHHVINKDNMEVIVDQTKAYQKGFTSAELLNYLQETLGNNFNVELSRGKNKFGAVSAIVTKKKATNDPQFQIDGQNSISKVKLADIERAFPGQNIIPLHDGSYAVRFKNGKGLSIQSMQDAGQGFIKLAIETGQMSENGKILGLTTGNEILLDTEFADNATLWHENKHVLDNLGMVTESDNAALNKEFNKLREVGKLDFALSTHEDPKKAMMENRANMFAQIMVNREAYRNTPFGKVIQRVMDFFNQLLGFGKQTVSGLAREVESGKIYERQPNGDFTTTNQPFAITRDYYKGGIVGYENTPGTGMFITPIKDVAQSYADYREDADTEVKIYEYIGDFEKIASPEKLEATIDELGLRDDWLDRPFEYLDPLHGDQAGIASKKITKHLKAQGYDAIQVEDYYAGQDVDVPEPSLFVLDPSKLKVYDDLKAQAEVTADNWYSELENAVAGAKGKQAPAGQWKGLIGGYKKDKNGDLVWRGYPGVRPEEVEWMGLYDWLDAQQGKVSKEAVMNFIRENNVKLEEVVYSGNQDRVNNPAFANDVYIDTDQSYFDYDVDEVYLNDINDNSIFFGTGKEVNDYIKENGLKSFNSRQEMVAAQMQEEPKHSGYQLPGGENYKELIVTLPFNKVMLEDVSQELYSKSSQELERKELRNLYSVVEDRRKQNNYGHGHWSGVTNPLVHVRFNERTDADGNKVLFLEEIQSDWHQQGRKEGYDKPNQTYHIKADTLMEELNQWEDAYYADEGEAFGNNDKAIATMDQWIIDNNLLSEDFEGLRSEIADDSNKNNNPSRENEYKFILDLNGIPNAPFKKSTQWSLLAMKRMVKYAAENGFDKIAWTTGQQQGDRYPGSDERTAGMKEFYDKILPNTFNKEFNRGKWGKAKVEVIETDLSEGGYTIFTDGEPTGLQESYESIQRTIRILREKWPERTFEVKKESDNISKQLSLPITERMRSKALREGMAMFEVREPANQLLSDAQYDNIFNQKQSLVKGFAQQARIKLTEARLLADRALGSISTRLGNVDPELREKLRWLDQDTSQKVIDVLKVAKRILDVTNGKKNLIGTRSGGMNAKDLSAWDWARLNSDKGKIEQLAQKYGLTEDLVELRDKMNQIRQDAIDVNYDVGFIDEYWPRVIKDREGFLQATEGISQDPVFSQAIRAEAKKLGLTQEQFEADFPEVKADIISNLILGRPSGIGGPGNIQERKFPEIPPEYAPFYMDADASLMQYVYSMTKKIEARKFFGKVPKRIGDLKAQKKKKTAELAKVEKFADMARVSNPEKIADYEARIVQLNEDLVPINEALNLYKINDRDFTENIGAYIGRLKTEGKVQKKDEKLVRDILDARFHEQGTHGIVNAYKNFAYIDTMGSFMSAITQVGDLAWAMYVGKAWTPSGFVGTGKNLYKAITNQSAVTKEDIGIERIAQEFADGTTLGNAVSWVFKVVGLEKIDSIGKEVLINNSLDQYKAQARLDSKGLAKQIKPTFGSESEDVVQEILAYNPEGNVDPSDNIKMLAYSKLLDFQPVALSEMPEMYLNGGNGRVFYMLKTYTMKQLDVFRREVGHNLKSKSRQDQITGMKNLVKLMGLLTLANATADELKDFLLGRETKFSDNLMENLMTIGGASRYTKMQVAKEGFGSAAFQQILPPAKFFNSASKDLNESYKEYVSGDTHNFGHERIIDSLPVAGKLYYWHYGRGNDNKKSINEQEFKKAGKDARLMKKQIENSDDKRAFITGNTDRFKQMKLHENFQAALGRNKAVINKLEKIPATENVLTRLGQLKAQREQILERYFEASEGLS